MGEESMKINKIRFLEPGNLPYRRSIKNLYVYDQYIRTPSHGLMTLATVAKEAVPDTLMYSESISKIRWDDVLDAAMSLPASSGKIPRPWWYWADFTPR